MCTKTSTSKGGQLENSKTGHDAWQENYLPGDVPRKIIDTNLRQSGFFNWVETFSETALVLLNCSGKWDKSCPRDYYNILPGSSQPPCLAPKVGGLIIGELHSLIKEDL